MPALLTSRPIAGCRSRTALATRSTSARSATSQASCSAPTSLATSISRSSPRASRTSCQPRRARLRAMAAPIPLEPPVTTATGPFSRGAFSVLNLSQPGISGRPSESDDLFDSIASDALDLAANPNVAPRLNRAPAGLQDDAELVRPALGGPGTPARGVEANGSTADGLDQTLAVEEADGLDPARRRGGDGKRRAALCAGRPERQQPGHGRPRRATHVDALDRRVRQDVGADLVDVLRLLVVRRQRSALEQTAANGRGRAGDTEQRQAAGRVVQRRSKQHVAPILDHERERID